MRSLNHKIVLLCLRVAYIRALSFILIILLLQLSATTLQARELRIAMSTWPPYVDSNMPHQGLAIAIVSTVFESAGYAPRVIIREWIDTLQGTLVGDYEVIAAAWKTPDREKQFVFSEPYLTNDIKFLKLRDRDIRFNKMSDFKGLTIGILNKYAYGNDFNSATDFIKVPAGDLLKNLEKLMNGSIDLTLGDERVLRYELNNHLSASKDKFTFIPQPLSSRTLHIAVSRTIDDCEKIVSDFNKALAEIKQEGSHKVLIRQFNEYIWKKQYLPDWQQK